MPSDEHPQIIGEYAPEELHDLEQNHALYLQLSKNPNKQLLLQLSETCHVYVTKRTVFCLDDELAMVVYEMEFRIGHNPVIGDYVWQTSVWRCSFATITQLPTDIFFNYLVSNDHVVLTDSKQSWDGKRFWMDRITNAFDRDLNVYFFDFSNNKLQKMHSKQEWLRFHHANQSKIWGKLDLHQMKRMIISDRELDVLRLEIL
jgi:hypothetical protein